MAHLDQIARLRRIVLVVRLRRIVLVVRLRRIVLVVRLRRIVFVCVPPAGIFVAKRCSFLSCAFILAQILKKAAGQIPHPQA